MLPKLLARSLPCRSRCSGPADRPRGRSSACIGETGNTIDDSRFESKKTKARMSARASARSSAFRSAAAEDVTDPFVHSPHGPSPALELALSGELAPLAPWADRGCRRRVFDDEVEVLLAPAAKCVRAARVRRP